MKLIKENQGKDIKVKDIPLDDYKALSQMNRHDGVCVFQFDTQLAAKVTDNMNGIRRFEDLQIKNKGRRIYVFLLPLMFFFEKTGFLKEKA